MQKIFSAIYEQIIASVWNKFVLNNLSLKNRYRIIELNMELL